MRLRSRAGSRFRCLRSRQVAHHCAVVLPAAFATLSRSTVFWGTRTRSNATRRDFRSENKEIVKLIDPRPLGTGIAPVPGSRWTRVWIPLGAGLFIFALVGSAIAVPQLRLLHAFQALIYVAVILLARRNSAWGFGAGFTIAVAWNSLQLFVTHLVQAGAHELWILVSTGQLRRPDTLLVFVGGIGHFVLIVACLVAFRQLRPGKKKWWQFLAGGLLALAYFGAIVATLLPR
jgi:hypothetical protein